MYDPDLYRDKAEVEMWKQRDPISAFLLRGQAANLLDPTDLESTDREVCAEVDAAVVFARGGTLEPVEELTRFVVSEDRQ